MQRVRVRLPARQGYTIEIGAGVLERLGQVARQSLSPHAQRIALISNRTVFDLYGAATIASLRAARFDVAHWLMGDGERYKSLRTAEHALQFLAETKLERSDAVVALGGGVVGDLAGFAAAVYLRGISFLQVPTTLLAQVDASVGGKTGVNTSTGKNLVGAFHQPRCVLIDTHTLRTLPRRELTAGWCEAIKQGAAGDRKLFEQTRRFLSGKQHIFEEEKPAVRLIAAQCAFKAKIVAGDEREEITRTDNRSRRILNFGHTIGHALEAVTGYKRFLHGEAVGYGMLAASEISMRLDLLDQTEAQTLRDVVRAAGRLPSADDLDQRVILSAVAADKKVVGGQVKWVLLEALGRARIVDGREVPTRIVRESLRAALRHNHEHVR
ncbi:MAG: 3-dehydroquinate synthase [Pyrinomonadaceae bacterium]|nr:3-dehydroquinate synthase [Pyrinomonadaceae bacterium]